MSWEKIAKEFQAERDALQKDLFRIQEERNNLIAENARLAHLCSRNARMEFNEALRAERAEAERDELDRTLTQCRALLKQECDDVQPLRERCDQYRRDAERYRWLRVYIWDQAWARGMQADAIDAEIDEVLATLGADDGC